MRAECGLDGTKCQGHSLPHNLDAMPEAAEHLSASALGHFDALALKVARAGTKQGPDRGIGRAESVACAPAL